MKVLITSAKDHAGSGQRFAEALRSAGVDATMLSHAEHRYGYGIDICVAGNRRKREATIKGLLDGVDVIHYKGDKLPRTGPFREWEHLVKPQVCRVLTAGGSGFRRKEEGIKDSLCLEWHPIRKYKERTDALGAITPDLLYDEDMVLVPHAYPESKNLWKPGNVIRIGHSPSHRGKKGTEDVFLNAIAILQAKGHKVEPVVIEGLSNKECVEAKASLQVFFDQGHASAYGISAVEAMMMGIPVVTRMKASVIARDPMYGKSPIMFFENTDPYEAANALERALLGGLESISKETHQWATSMHSYSAVVPRLLSLYEKGLTKARCRQSQ